MNVVVDAVVVVVGVVVESVVGWLVLAACNTSNVNWLHFVLSIFFTVSNRLFPCSAWVGLFPQLSAFTLTSVATQWSFEAMRFYWPDALPHTKPSTSSIAIRLCL